MSIERTPEVQAKYDERKKELDGRCPFCECEEELIESFQYYLLIKNRFPYEEAIRHWLLIPKRHIEELEECSEWENMEFLKIARQLESQYPEMEMRIKFKENKGKSVKHLHWHLTEKL